MPKNNPAKLAGLRLPDYSGSWWKHHFSNLTTLPVGKWCPVTVMDLPGGSLLKLKPNMRYEGLPQISPLYGGWTQRTKFYIAPYRLYISELRKNLHQSWGSIPNLELPEMTFGRQMPTEDFYDSGLAFSNQTCSLAGSLLDRLGIAWGDMYSGNSFVKKEVDFPYNSGVQFDFTMRSNLVPLLAYIDAWLYGEFNPQDKNIPVDNDRIIVGDTFGRYTSVNWVSYDNLKKLVPAFAFGDGLSYSGITSYLPSKTGKQLNFDWETDFQLVPNYNIFTTYGASYSGNASSVNGGDLRLFITQNWDSLRNSTSCVGLLPVTYKGDYFTSWFSDEGITTAEKYLITANESLLSLRRKNQDMLISLLSVVSGNRYVDYLQYIFDQELELKDHPILIGFDEIDFGGVDIVANAETSQGSQPIGTNSVLGATAHKVKNYNSSVKPISVKLKEPSLLLVCSAIVPNVYYWQGTPRFMYNRTVSDLWHPQYQKQGFMQTYRGEYINPFAMNQVLSSSNWVLRTEDEDTFFDNPEDINHIAVSYVPLGWEHMERFSSLGGAMKTDAFKTWSLARDFGSLRSNYVEGVLDYNDNYERYEFNPFVFEGIDLMRSTYVDAGAYNYMFQNSSRANSNNFIVRFSYDMSIYQPLVHTLVDKQGL